MLIRPRALAALAGALVVALGAPPVLGDEAQESARGSASHRRADGDRGLWREERFAAERAEFLDALDAAARGQLESRGDSERLRAYPLYPYVEAARIEKALQSAASADAAADADARRFLAAHGAAPVAREVRRAWLESLARRGDWPTFLEIFAPAGADQALQCQALNARIALDAIEGLAPRIVATWLTASQLPLECEPAFRWLRAEGLLTDELVEQRIALLLENGQTAFARVIAQRLPAERAAPLLRLADLLEHPRRSLDALLAKTDVDLPPAALLDGWRRLARNDPAAALERYERVVDVLALDRREQSRFALALALGLAWDRRSEALEYFARVAPEDLDDYALGWLARAALWSGDWRRAADAITAMSATERDETRWRYWYARAAEALRDRKTAADVYRSILPRDNYYAAMAAARLGEPAKPHPQSLELDDERVRSLGEQPGFVRARELKYAGLPWHAAAEWQHASTALADGEGKGTIALAMRIGWYDVAIATASRHRVYDDYELLYPRPYDEAVATAARLTKLEPPLIYGVIRQESLYRPDAASAAGAIGLTQLLPGTAKRAARHFELPVPSYAELFVPDVNVTIGAAELRRLIDAHGKQIPVGLAGYNAGPQAVARWLPDEPLDADIWIENIPYNETRDYVQRVLWHSLVFAWLETKEPRSTESWLAKIEPAASDLKASR